MTDATDMSLMSTMQDQDSQASQNSPADQSSFGSVDQSFKTTPTGSMSPKIIMGVLGGCVGLMVIALVVVIVYFVVVKSCTGDNSGGGSGGGGGGGSGGGGGGSGACPAPSTTTGVACTANADLTYSCVENCAALTFPAGSGCTAKPNATTNLCDITCAAQSSCTTESFDASDPKTWVANQDGKCVGTVFGGGDSYCSVVPPLSNNQYRYWDKVPGMYQPNHLIDGLKSLAGQASGVWKNVADWCGDNTNRKYPCTGLDIFYDKVNNNTYYVPCMLHPGTNVTETRSNPVATNPFPFDANVTVEHLGPFITQMFNGQTQQTQQTQQTTQTTKTTKTKKLPGW
jgi:hypothetical protein